MARLRVSIADVAARARVSTGTVSNTLNHPERVTGTTRERVMAAVRELGFIPNQSARVLTGAPSKTLGLVVVDVLSPFYMEVAHAVERTASAAGYVMILCNSENEHDREAELLQVLTAQRVAGALVSPAGGGSPAAEAGTPTVLIDYEDDDHPCSVRVDHVAGGRMAAQHLIGLGHRDIAFVGGLPTLRQFEERVRGCQEAMADGSLDPGTLREIRSDGIGIESGRLSAGAMLEAGTLPTGIICGNDMLAFGVYRGLAGAGVRVPEDVALVGYDDVDFAANWIVPLTSVRQPTRDMGETAARLLIDHVTHPGHEHQRVVLEPVLVVRRSSGCYEE
ncbi:LacI family DNA-binding transcriptional regulator [Tessaracoccus sp. ZS01]|uniref:LacI family DNA-binding transcriptional regulator n=1 Tax=Tessaracoccus sp. ZS01 TaxID=1906324 RepID=UPI00130196CB|nr:LacI family DNA-binding transcriptional regulator [Tessaracoccus sp. ZS01]